ncbi:MAG: hypothetical protein OEZ13_01310 [Spirochaetia bacterium]|nr:hypothetical protein [Spirochaetia bacterium]
MAKRIKIFFNRRAKLSEINQYYVSWLLLIFIFILFASVKGVTKREEIKNISSLKTYSIKNQDAGRLIGSLNSNFPEWFKNTKRDYNILSYLKENITLKSWRSNLIISEKCKSLTLYKKGPQRNHYAILLPWNAKNNIQGIYTGLSVLETLDNANLKDSVSLVFFDNKNDCVFTDLFIKETFPIRPNTMLFLYPDENDALHISSTGSRFSSINWYNYFPDKRVPSISEQISQSAFPFLAEKQSYFLKNNIPAFGVTYKTKISDKKYHLSNIYGEHIINYINIINEIPLNSLSNQSFWLSKQGALKYWVIITFFFFGIILLLLPFLVRSSERYFPVNGILSVIYFSIIVTAYALLNKIYLALNNESFLIILLFYILAVVSTLLIIKFEKKIYATKINQQTSYLTYIIIICLIGIYNKTLFFLLIPSAFLLRNNKYKRDIKTYIYIVISYFIPVYFLFNNGSAELSLLLSAEFIDERIFYDTYSIFAISFIIGGIISFIKYEKQEYS